MATASRVCLQCHDDNLVRARTRGLCDPCYRRSRKEVLQGKTTWAKLEQAGLAQAVQKLGKALDKAWSQRFQKPRQAD